MSFLAIEQLLHHGRPPETVVARRQGQPLTWAAFVHDVAALVPALKAKRRYALVTGDAWWFAVGLLAVWHAGAEVVVPTNAQPQTLQDLAETYDELLDDAVLHARRAPAAGALPWAVLEGENCRLTLFTSGTSGVPKPVGKCLRQLSAEVAVLEHTWGAPLGQATVLATVPHHHIYGLLFRLLWPLSAGRPFEIQVGHLPEDLQAQAQAAGSVVLISSPAHLSRLPALMDLSVLLPSVCLCVSSGGALSAQAVAALVEAGAEAPLEILGSTETGGMAWRRQRPGDTAWCPVPGVRCASSAQQTLEVSSPFLPDRCVWVTADAVVFLPDGRFELHGRRDRVVKLEEKRLSLDEQEHRLAAHPWLLAAALWVQPARRSTLCAAVALSAEGWLQLHQQGKWPLQKALRQHLAAWYEPVLLPRRWRFVPTLPLTERGKTDWAAVQALFADS